MKKNLVMFVAVAMGLLIFQVSAGADQISQKEMDAAQFFVGTWSCAHTEGGVTGPYTTTIVKSLGNAWLKQTYDFAATANEPAFQGEWFLRYDERVHHWVRFGALSDGMYFAMTGKRTNDTWSWTYVLPGPGATAVFVKKSDSEYTIDGPSYTNEWYARNRASCLQQSALSGRRGAVNFVPLRGPACDVLERSPPDARYCALC